MHTHTLLPRTRRSFGRTSWTTWASISASCGPRCDYIPAPLSTTTRHARACGQVVFIHSMLAQMTHLIVAQRMETTKLVEVDLAIKVRHHRAVGALARCFERSRENILTHTNTHTHTQQRHWWMHYTGAAQHGPVHQGGQPRAELGLQQGALGAAPTRHVPAVPVAA